MKEFDSNPLFLEYSSVREELLATSKSIRQFNLTTITIAAAAISFSLQFDKPWFSLLGFCYAFISFVYVKMQNFKIQNLSIYLEVFVENQIDELNWNTLRSGISNKTWWGSKGIDSILVLYFFVLFGCGAVSLFLFLREVEVLSSGLSICSFLILFFLLGFIVIFIYSRNRETKYRQDWEAEFNNLKAK